MEGTFVKKFFSLCLVFVGTFLYGHYNSDKNYFKIQAKNNGSHIIKIKSIISKLIIKKPENNQC